MTATVVTMGMVALLRGGALSRSDGVGAVVLAAGLHALRIVKGRTYLLQWNQCETMPSPVLSRRPHAPATFALLLG